MYIDQNLAAGEEILCRPVYHWVRYAPALVAFAIGNVLLVAGAVFWIIVGLQPLGLALGAAGLLGDAVGVAMWTTRHFRFRFDEFAVTNRRILRKTGLVHKEVWQCPLDKVQDITVTQGFWGQLLGYGTVEVETAGEGKEAEAVFADIRKPEQLRTAIWDVYGRSRGTAAPVQTVRDRLAELDRLKADSLVSDAEYAEARQKILMGI